MVEQSLDECWFGDELRPVAEAMGLGEFTSYQGYGGNDDAREWFSFKFKRGTLSVFAVEGSLIASLGHDGYAWTTYITIHGTYDEVLNAAQLLGVNRLTERAED